MTNPSFASFAGPGADGSASLVVISHHRIADADRAAFLVDAEKALDTLSRRPGFVRGSIGQATDAAESVVLQTEWRDVGSYRHALSAYEVKIDAVPLLATGLDGASAFELIRRWDARGKSVSSSGRTDGSGAGRRHEELS